MPTFNRPREKSGFKPFKIPKGLDQSDRLLYMASAPDLALIWDDWTEIVDRTLPEGYSIEDCQKVAIFDPEFEMTADEIKDRMQYLSDRLDPARCFVLDWAIRKHLNKPQRC